VIDVFSAVVDLRVVDLIQNNLLKPNTRTVVQGIPVLGYFFYYTVQVSTSAVVTFPCKLCRKTHPHPAAHLNSGERAEPFLAVIDVFSAVVRVVDLIQNNLLKPNTRTAVQGIPVLGYIFLVHCARINLCCSNYPL
jgi:hypothetical protein